MSFYSDYFDLVGKKIKEIDFSFFEKAANSIKSVHTAGGKLIIAGNGASATIASHVSVDFTKSAGIRAINFNEAGLLTCFSNDFGYEMWIEKALEFYADASDLIILISSSGTSKNIINGARKARIMGLPLITFSGFAPDNPLSQMGDINFWIESMEYNVVEIVHSVWLVSLVDRISESI